MANRFGEGKDMDIRADDPTRPDWERDAKAAADLAEEAGARAGEAAGKVAGEAQRKLRRATDRASEVYDRTTERATQAYRSLRDYAIEHPGTAVAVTFGAGVVCGMSLARRRAMDDYQSGIVPTVAVALASAVLDVFSARR
jgi:ElaB/YqjD/DUF883 family membrane-anchored ribosome-binding protein